METYRNWGYEELESELRCLSDNLVVQAVLSLPVGQFPYDRVQCFNALFASILMRMS